jgi:hypothetical protein
MGWESELLLSRLRMGGLLLPTTRMASAVMSILLLSTSTALYLLLMRSEGVERYSIAMIEQWESRIFLIIVLCLVGIYLSQAIATRAKVSIAYWARLMEVLELIVMRCLGKRVFELIMDKNNYCAPSKVRKL